MGRKKYSDEIISLKRRIENIRRLVSIKNRGVIRELEAQYGREHPLVHTGWWLVQHIGQLRLTIAERLNKYERLLERRRVTRQLIEYVKYELEDLRRLLEHHERLVQYLRTLREFAEEIEAKLYGRILDMVQSGYADTSDFNELEHAAWRYFMSAVKYRGALAKPFLDSNYGFLLRVARWFPKVRVRIYVFLVLARETVIISRRQGRPREVRYVTIKTPYVMHLDDYLKDYELWNQRAVAYAAEMLMSMTADYEIESYEVDLGVEEAP